MRWAEVQKTLKRIDNNWEYENVRYREMSYTEKCPVRRSFRSILKIVKYFKNTILIFYKNIFWMGHFHVHFDLHEL